MIHLMQKRHSLPFRILSFFICFSFMLSMVVPPSVSHAQILPATALNLPGPNVMVNRTPGFRPALIKGITVHPENPLEFDFIVYNGDSRLEGEALRAEAKTLVKYFLTSLTVPEDEMWVNLSPYEADRIIPKGFGETEMGRDLLAQDYLLKQLTASLVYPEDELGASFWERVHQKVEQKYGVTDIPMNTFNKVWIVPDQAVVYQHEFSAYVIESHLKVMLEEDYLALQKNLVKDESFPNTDIKGEIKGISSVTSEAIREILIPEIEKEVNEGKNFAKLRQVYTSMILATWYKMNLKQSLLSQIYVDKNKTKGVHIDDPAVIQKIYDQYVNVFGKGVYNYIREEYDPVEQTLLPKKYFSGGIGLQGSNLAATRKIIQGNMLEGEPAALAPEDSSRIQKSLTPAEDELAFEVTLDFVEYSGGNEVVVAQAEAAVADTGTLADGAMTAGLKFGTSGLRATVEEFTDKEVYINTRGFIEFLRNNGDFTVGDTIVLGGDLRMSTPKIMAAVARTISDAGGNVVNLGKVPTPTAANYAARRNLAAVVVTGSHIPATMNGIKFYKTEGEVLKEDEPGILSAVSLIRESVTSQPSEESIFDEDDQFKPGQEYALEPVTEEGRAEFLRRYTDLFASDALAGKKIVVYQHTAVGRDMLAELLASLGAEVVTAERADETQTFVSIDTEDVKAEDEELFKRLIEENPGAFAIVSTDGDSDRPFVIDETGKFHRGDVLGVVVSQFLGVDFVAVPVSASDAVNQQLEADGIVMKSTRIGSPYVIKTMQDAEAEGYQRIVSWEVNGGYLTQADFDVGNGVLKALPTRDAFLPILVTLLSAIEKELKVSDLFNALPQRPTHGGLIDNFPREEASRIVREISPDLEENIEIVEYLGSGEVRVTLFDQTERVLGSEDPLAQSLRAIKKGLEPYFRESDGFAPIDAIRYTDGVKIQMGTDIAHLRASGNAPQFRTYSIADSQERANEIVSLALAEPNGILRRLEKGDPDAAMMAVASVVPVVNDVYGRTGLQIQFGTDKTRDTILSPIWKMAGRQFQFVQLAPNTRFNLDQTQGDVYVKVIKGRLVGNVDRRPFAAPFIVRNTQVTDGYVVSGSTDTIIAIQIITNGASDRIYDIKDLQLEGSQAGKLSWRRFDTVMPEEKAFQGLDFYNLPAFKLMDGDKELTFVQLWAAAEGVDAQPHDHTGDHPYAETHWGVYNGTGRGGMYDARGSRYVIQTGDEHGRFWNEDADGTPKLREDGSVEYPMHGWASGELVGEAKGTGGYDVWFVFENTRDYAHRNLFDASMLADEFRQVYSQGTGSFVSRAADAIKEAGTDSGSLLQVREALAEFQKDNPILARRGPDQPALITQIYDALEGDDLANARSIVQEMLNNVQVPREARYAVVMAGGVGSRFWPLGRENLPKQYVKLFGEDNMTQIALRRLVDENGPGNIIVVVSQNDVERTQNVVDEDDILVKERDRIHIVGEPMRGGTTAAPLIALAFAQQHRANQLGIELSTAEDFNKVNDQVQIELFTADHITGPGFIENRDDMARNAWMGPYIALQGKLPDFYNDQFGQQVVGEEVVDGLFNVKVFGEKDPELAKRWEETPPPILWNAGYFAARADTLMKILTETASKDAQETNEALKGRTVVDHLTPLHEVQEAFLEPSSEKREQAIEGAYQKWAESGQAWDVAFAETVALGASPSVGELTSRMQYSWYDIGTADQIADFYDKEQPELKDERGNFAVGPTLNADNESSNNVALGLGGANVSLFGVEGLQVVVQEDSVLVMGRGEAGGVKTLANMGKDHSVFSDYFLGFQEPSVQPLNESTEDGVTILGLGLNVFTTDSESKPTVINASNSGFLATVGLDAKYQEGTITVVRSGDNVFIFGPGAAEQGQEKLEEIVAVEGDIPAAKPVSVQSDVQNYDWGDPDFIPKLIGVANPEKKPFAELWIGAHPSLPSTIDVAGKTVRLDDYIGSNPESVLGEGVARQFGRRLPFLLKVLTAGKRNPLSIQAHPTKAQAEEGFAKENAAGKDIKASDRNYKDPNHKPELIVAIEDGFWALRGFRNIDDIVSTFEAIGIRELSAEFEDFKVAVITSKGDDEQQRLALSDFYKGIMGKRKTSEEGPIVQQVVDYAKRQAQKTNHDIWAERLNNKYPGDIGVLSAYLLNVIELKAGQGMFLPAGELHAYLEGNGIEIMANSDNVLRGGLTPKRVDVPELLKVLTFTHGEIPILEPQPISATESIYETPLPDFRLSVIEVAKGTDHVAQDRDRIDMMLVLEGEVEVIDQNENVVRLQQGQSMMNKASVARYTIRSVTDRARLYKATTQDSAMVAQAIAQLDQQLPLSFDRTSDSVIALHHFPALERVIGSDRKIADVTKQFALLTTVENKLYKKNVRRAVSVLNGLAFFRQLLPGQKKQVLDDFKSLGYDVTAEWLQKNTNLPFDKLAARLEQKFGIHIGDDVAKYIKIHDSAVRTSRGIRIGLEAQKSSIQTNIVADLIVRQNALRDVVFGLSKATQIGLSDAEFEALSELLWGLHQVEGIRINLVQLSKGQYLAYEEYKFKRVARDNGLNLGLTRQGLEHLIKLDMARGSGVFFDLVSEQAEEVKYRLDVNNIHRAIGNQEKDKTFIRWDDELAIWRANPLAARVYEIERPRVNTTTIATMEREEAFRVQLESEAESTKIFNRRSAFLIVDDSRGEVLDANAEVLDDIYGRFGIISWHVTPERREVEFDYYTQELVKVYQDAIDDGGVPNGMTQRSFDALLEVLRYRGVLKGGQIDQQAMRTYLVKNVFDHISGVRNRQLLLSKGEHTVMSMDDDAPPETYVLNAAERKAVMDQRHALREQAMGQFRVGVGALAGQTIDSEDELYRVLANMDLSSGPVADLVNEYFGYEAESLAGKVPLAMEEIREIDDLLLDKDGYGAELEISHQRYHKLQSPFPRYMLTGPDFAYRRPRTEKKEGAFNVIPVNVYAPQDLLGMRVGDTDLPIMGSPLDGQGSLRGTMFHPVSSEMVAKLEDDRITYIPFPFIEDQDTGGVAQAIRYLEIPDKRRSNLQHTDQSALIVQGVLGAAAREYVIFNRSMLLNERPSPSIGRDLRFEEPPYILWVRSLMERDGISVAFSTVAGGQQREIGERMYVISHQDYTEVVGVLSRAIYEKAVRRFAEEVKGHSELLIEGAEYERLRFAATLYMNEANKFELTEELKKEFLYERKIRAQIMADLGVERNRKVEEFAQDSENGDLAQQIRDIDLIMVQYANSFFLYHAQDQRGDNYSPVDLADDNFYRIVRNANTIKWEAVIPDIDVQVVRGIKGATRSEWVSVDGRSGSVNIDADRTYTIGKPLQVEVERGKNILMSQLPQEGAEIIVPAYTEDLQKADWETIYTKIHDQVLSDGELLLVWSDLVDAAIPWWEKPFTSADSSMARSYPLSESESAGYEKEWLTRRRAEPVIFYPEEYSGAEILKRWQDRWDQGNIFQITEEEVQRTQQARMLGDTYVHLTPRDRKLRTPTWSEQTEIRLNQPFNPDGFHFAKVPETEILFDLDLAGQDWRIVIKPDPLHRGHSLLIPRESAPQFLRSSDLDAYTDMLQKSEDSYLVYHSIWGASSVNSMHFQIQPVSGLPEQIQDLPLFKNARENRSVGESHVLSIQSVITNGNPVQGFSIRSDNPKELSRNMRMIIERLQEQNQPFSIIGRGNQVFIFLIAQEAPEILGGYPIGAAALAGTLSVAQADVLNALTEEKLREGFAAYTVSEERFLSLSKQFSNVLTAGGDAAPASEDRKVGGINLNPAMLDLQIKRDANGVPMSIDQQPIFDMKIDGFIPVIINVTPIANLPLILGFVDTREDIPGTRDLGSLDPADRKARFEIEELEPVG